VVSTRPEDCKDFSFYECQDTTYYWYTEPQQIQSSNDLMLLYNDSQASSNFSGFYVPPSEYIVLRLYTNDCDAYDDVGTSLYIATDPGKDDVTDAGKTYSVASAKSEFMENIRSSSCEYDFRRMANSVNDVSASFASTTVALSLCLATLLFLM
jgi:hypothetical protein